MDNNLLAAIVPSVTTAGSTAGVAITALILNNKRFDLLEKRLDTLERCLERIETRLEGMERDYRKLYVDMGRVKAKLGIA